MPTLAVDHLIGDPPYSSRTHRGHDQSEEIANRKQLDFEPWDYGDVMRFVDAQRLSVLGWRVIFSDHVLQPAWEKFFEMTGLYTFAPIPYVVPGGRVRLSGDGPTCWATWINAARPKEGRFSGCGSMPGAYVLPKGERDKNRVVGGKELWVMKRLVEDYSRPGDVVLDPVCGSGTTLLAAVLMGRKCIGIDSSEKACEIAVERVRSA
jgi:site-specific DNA-methyltransferase (adenine-specific)